jgi:hypothetical protein
LLHFIQNVQYPLFDIKLTILPRQFFFHLNLKYQVFINLILKLILKKKLKIEGVAPLATPKPTIPTG